MTIVDGQWVPETDPGEHVNYPNYRALDDLVALTNSTEFDFVIVGGGGAGAVAAIEAADHGASALILEKMATPGGSTLAAGGTIRLVSDLEGMAEHFYQLAQGATPRDVIDAFVTGLAEVPQWFADHGGELAERNEEGRSHGDPRLFPISRPGSSFPNFASSDALAPRALLRATRPNRRPGAVLWDFLSDRLAEREVPVVLGARVVRLLEEGEARAVTGVEVEHPKGNVVVRARRAVILCSGGFAYDRELMTQYYGVELPTVCPVGCATGDGVRMAQDVGADLWHMNATAASIGYWPEELKAGFQMKMPDYGFVMVDQLARRYVWETALENHSAVHSMLAQDSVTGEYLRTPSYVIFDEATRLAGTLAHLPHGENRDYPWSKDNSAEVERGWIKRADTPRELAALLGLPADELEHVVSSFNATAEGDSPDQFGRPASEMRAIASPPFYGAKVFPIIVNTQGGPRRNARSEIVRPDGHPIPGLYGAGELGSIWNRLYPGAGNVGECFVSARLAVRSALGKLEELPIPTH